MILLNQIPPLNLHFTCSAHARKQQVEKPRVELRQFFPETWLFQLSEVGPEGQLNRLAYLRLSLLVQDPLIPPTPCPSGAMAR